MTLIKTITINTNANNTNSIVKVIDRDQLALSTIGRARLVPEARLDQTSCASTARARLVPEAKLAPERLLRPGFSVNRPLNHRTHRWQAAACCAKTKLAWATNRARTSGRRSRPRSTTSTRAAPTTLN
jgi:hypothetical protein